MSKNLPVHDPSWFYLQFPVLASDAKLDGEPVAGGELLYELVAGPKRCEADLLAELSEGGVCKQRDMAQQLVADILWAALV